MSTKTGTEMANILAQYWKACTSVMPFMPPRATFRVITAPTTTTPAQYGKPFRMPPSAPCGARQR